MKSTNYFKAAIRHGQRYRNFCKERKLIAFPVRYKTLAPYIIAFVQSRKGSTKSIGYVHSALRNYTRECNQRWLTDSDRVKLSRIIALMKYEDRKPIRQSEPLTLHVLIQVYNKNKNRAEDGKALAALFVGHDALLRCQELLTLQVAQVEWYHPLQRATISIARSKTHRTGAPQEIHLLLRDEPCGFKLLWQHLQRNGLLQKPDAFIFSLDHTHTKPATRSWLTQSIKRLVRTIGLNSCKYSSHSLRAGGATDLHLAGTPIDIIKKGGRWKSDVVLKYLRDDLFVAASCNEAFSSVSQMGGSRYPPKKV